MSSHAMNQIELSRIETLLQRALPGVELLGEPVSTRKGLFNEGWRVTSTEGTLLVKLNESPTAADEHFARAADASERMAEHGLAAPRVLAFGRTEDLPAPDVPLAYQSFLIQEWMIGQDAEDYLSEASAAQAGQLFRDLGALIGALHNIPYARGVDEAQAVDTRVLTREKLAALLERNRECGVLTADELGVVAATVTQLLDRHKLHIRARMTHHDLHLPNVLIRPDGSVALIDLDFMRPGDPLEDFVKLDLWAFEKPTYRAAFRTGYAGTHAEPWPADAGLRIHTHQILNSLSYVAFFSEHDPQGIPEWTGRLRALCAAGAERLAATQVKEEW